MDHGQCYHTSRVAVSRANADLHSNGRLGLQNRNIFDIYGPVSLIVEVWA